MKILKAFVLSLVLLTVCQKEALSSFPHKTKSHIEPGGVEFVFTAFDFGKKSKYTPFYPCLDCRLKATKLLKGKEVYSVVYQIDENGSRITSHSNLPGKTKHFLLIDGSVAFGEGLRDEATLIDQINRQSKIYHAYDIGFLGHGPQHNWLAFSQQTLPKVVVEKSGRAVLISHDQDIRRFIETPDHLIYSAQFPNVIEKSPGQFEYLGTMKESGTFTQKLLIKLCVPLLSCRTQMTKSYALPTEEQIAKAARLFDSIEKMYREQFQAESFTIVWTGSPATLDILKKYSHSKILTIEYERFDSNHPSEKGAAQIVDSIMKNIL